MRFHQKSAYQIYSDMRIFILSYAPAVNVGSFSTTSYNGLQFISSSFSSSLLKEIPFFFFCFLFSALS